MSELKICSGRFYRTRDGRKVGPISYVRNDGVAYFSERKHDGQLCCFPDGKIEVDKVECGGDLIAEWTDTPDTTTPPLAPTDPYAPLRRVLNAAYEQAANGKGKERHANNKPFTDQPIMEIARMVGPGYQLGQAMKKAQEAGGMIQRGQPDRAKAELLGAINYLAACVLLIEEDQK